MPGPLLPCSACERHVRESDSACPFCGLVRSPERGARTAAWRIDGAVEVSRGPRELAPRLAAAALMTASAAALAHCGSSSGSAVDAGLADGELADVGLAHSGLADAGFFSSGDADFVGAPPYGAPSLVDEECTGAGDCPPGEICCLVVSSFTIACQIGPCRDSGLGVSQVCTTQVECPAGTTCGSIPENIPLPGVGILQTCNEPADAGDGGDGSNGAPTDASTGGDGPAPVEGGATVDGAMRDTGAGG